MEGAALGNVFLLPAREGVQFVTEQGKQGFYPGDGLTLAMLDCPKRRAAYARLLRSDAFGHAVFRAKLPDQLSPKDRGAHRLTPLSSD
jgi:hypothetical protein